MTSRGSDHEPSAAQPSAAASLYARLRPLLFALDPHTAHALAFRALDLAELAPPLRSLLAALHPVADDPVTTMGLRFPNRVGLAAGLDKDGRAPRALAALGFGFLELGTVTALAQEPNPRPNLFRLPDDQALVNRLGFPNRGAAALAQRLVRRRPEVPVGISIGKSRVVSVDDPAAVRDDYLASFRAVQAAADFVVVNVSSPNTANLRAMQRADAARALLQALVDERDQGHGRHVPLLLKIAPDLEPEALDALLDVVASTGIEGVVATNTTVAREPLRSDAAWVASLGAGGLSGPPLTARSRAVVAATRRRLPRATVIGVGGIGSVADARAMLDAGADLVQVYTALIYQGPGLPSRLARGLRASASG